MLAKQIAHRFSIAKRHAHWKPQSSIKNPNEDADVYDTHVSRSDHTQMLRSEESTGHLPIPIQAFRDLVTMTVCVSHPLFF